MDFPAAFPSLSFPSFSPLSFPFLPGFWVLLWATGLLAGCAAMPEEKTCKEARQGREVAQRPIYPRESKRLREEGQATLLVHVSRLGYVREIRLQESSGYPRLDHSAIKAVQTWCFAPALDRSRERVDAWVRLPVAFKLME